MTTPPSNRIVILGIPFLNGTVQESVDETLKGGLLTVPSAPALATIAVDFEYRQALLESDVVIPDSGYMVMLWNLLHWRSPIVKISGLAFLRELFDQVAVGKKSTFFLINPSIVEARKNRDYLGNLGIDLAEKNMYTAPLYGAGPVDDTALLNAIEATRPDIVLINLGGGTQEKLGLYLKQSLSYSPAIICTGAAIAFLTGSQAHIPPWADRLYLGWLLRIVSNPRLYGARYLKSIRLAIDIIKFGATLPPLSR